ncbi:hypothetical protein PHMEG_00013491 [Phytophthora megakarya]|uniref:Bzip transcription factor n=1 Tax=Phytophthora megakarya TaxID=4795 RepID=A0A225W8R5_9STRA|nr:hypothetical protein PHMEG_00013491 [Phytophthora megakarya]
MYSGFQYSPNGMDLSSQTIRDVIPRTKTPRQGNFIVESTGIIAGTEADKQSRRPNSGRNRPTMPNSSKDHELQRELRRQSQARYRQRQRRGLQALQDDLERLQKEIKAYQQLGLSSVEPNIWFVAQEYFRLFRHGFKEPSLEKNAIALAFLQKSTVPDVSDGYFRGPKSLLRTWELFSLCFDDVYVELESMEKKSEGILFATTTTSVTISRNTLRLVFPRLNSDERGGVDGGRWSSQADRLKGQRLVMTSSTRFDWDAINNRVVRILSSSDMLTAIFRVLGSLEDVSVVFNGALVTPDGRLVVHSGYF